MSRKLLYVCATGAGRANYPSLHCESRQEICSITACRGILIGG